MRPRSSGCLVNSKLFTFFACGLILTAAAFADPVSFVPAASGPFGVTSKTYGPITGTASTTRGPKVRRDR